MTSIDDASCLIRKNVFFVSKYDLYLHFGEPVEFKCSLLANVLHCKYDLKAVY